ncbi:MAG: hypothetical protein J5725_10340 [Bacteroidales bacterium]|nr:hypothetical protein [Bacteroidales bacterium]
MNYIINPSWFYWISVVNGLQTFLIILAVVLAVVAIICFITAYEEGECGDNENSKKWAKRGIICTVTAIAIAIICIFIPSKSTLIEMQIAKFATYENAEWTADKIKEAVDYIINAIQNMKG